MKESSVDNGSNNVVEGMGPCGNAETANRKEHGEIDACSGTKAELGPIEGCGLTEPAFQIYYMMMRAK